MIQWIIIPDNQNTFQKKSTVSGEKTHKEAVTIHTNNVAILGDSIINLKKKQNFKAAIIHIGTRWGSGVASATG